jgi:hypothetical protein
MTLPQAEDALKTYFGEKYDDQAWRPALDAVLAAENDVSATLEAIKKLKSASSQCTTAVTPKNTPTLANTTQCRRLEEDVLESIRELQGRKRVFGIAPTLDKFIEPTEEKEVGEGMRFEGDDEIVTEVHREGAVKRGEVIEVDSDDEADNGDDEGMTNAEMMSLCQRLEKASILSSAECALDVSTVLRRFRAQLLKIGLETAKQTKLTSFWAPERSRDAVDVAT